MSVLCFAPKHDEPCDVYQVNRPNSVNAQGGEEKNDPTNPQLCILGEHKGVECCSMPKAPCVMHLGCSQMADRHFGKQTGKQAWASGCSSSVHSYSAPR